MTPFLHEIMEMLLNERSSTLHIDPNDIYSNEDEDVITVTFTELPAENE